MTFCVPWSDIAKVPGRKCTVQTVNGRLGHKAGCILHGQVLSAVGYCLRCNLGNIRPRLGPAYVKYDLPWVLSVRSLGYRLSAVLYRLPAVLDLRHRAHKPSKIFNPIEFYYPPYISIFFWPALENGLSVEQNGQLNIKRPA